MCIDFLYTEVKCVNIELVFSSDMTLEIVKSLKGHSGCVLSILKKDDVLYVRKSSAGKEYNMRLKKQLLRQLAFKSSTVKTPKIYEYGYKDNLFYFDMEYISSVTLAEYISFANVNRSFSNIIEFLKLLFDNLYLKDTEQNPKANTIFCKKIRDLKSKLINQNENFKLAFYVLENFDWSNIDKSPCHGDLTLENILIDKNKQLYLIDFLDSFYYSWMIDIAKLLQDLDRNWSYRNITLDRDTKTRIQYAKELLIDEIKKLPNGQEKLKSIYHILLLNIIRIYPYSKDKLTINYLDEKVKYLVKLIREERIGETII